MITRAVPMMVATLVIISLRHDSKLWIAPIFMAALAFSFRSRVWGFSMFW